MSTAEDNDCRDQAELQTCTENQRQVAHKLQFYLKPLCGADEIGQHAVGGGAEAGIYFGDGEAGEDVGIEFDLAMGSRRDSVRRTFDSSPAFQRRVSIPIEEPHPGGMSEFFPMNPGHRLGERFSRPYGTDPSYPSVPGVETAGLLSSVLRTRNIPGTGRAEPYSDRIADARARRSLREILHSA